MATELNANADWPERTPLGQAVRWIAERDTVLSIEEEEATGDVVGAEAASYSKARRDLVLALRRKSIPARGDVEIYDEACEKFSIVNAGLFIEGPEWDSYLPNLLKSAKPLADGSRIVRDRPVPSSLWREPWIKWAPSQLHYDRGEKLQGRIGPITVGVADLLRLFPSDQVSNGDKAKPPRTGRPPVYKWNAFYAEIAIMAELDGLPKKQSTLEARMLNWCLEKWGTEPAESVIREKVAAIYSHPRKA